MKDENLPLLTNRHYNKAREDLGKVYRTKTNLPNEYPEIGCIEVNNAVNLLATSYAEIESLKMKNSKIFWFGRGRLRH